MAKVVRDPTVTPKAAEEVGTETETRTMRGGDGKWRIGGRLARSRLAKTTTMDLRCNDSKARLEGPRISLEDLEDLGVHRTNQVVLKDSKVRQEEDLQINQEGHKTNQEDRQTNQGGRLINQEDRRTKEGLPPKRWIRIRVTLTTKHLPQKARRLQKEKLRPRASRLRKGNLLQEKENHHQRGSRALQMEQGLKKNQLSLFRITEHLTKDKVYSFVLTTLLACLYLRILLK